MQPFEAQFRLDDGSFRAIFLIDFRGSGPTVQFAQFTWIVHTFSREDFTNATAGRPGINDKLASCSTCIILLLTKGLETGNTLPNCITFTFARERWKKTCSHLVIISEVPCVFEEIAQIYLVPVSSFLSLFIWSICFIMFWKPGLPDFTKQYTRN